MACLRLLVTILVATLWFSTLIDAAAIHTLEFDAGRQQNIAPDGETIGNTEKIRFQRAIETAQESAPRTCGNAMPCGWAVYVPFTRRMDYFMKNTCVCRDTYKCIRTDDDLSVSAYVYRCRKNTGPTDIESPNESEMNVY